MPPLWQDITDELGITTENLNYGYATAYGSLTVACVIFIPLSINFGRRPVYLMTSLIMIASAAWMGCMKTTADVLGSNFLSGIAGAVNEALFNMTICDLFFVHQRGTMTGIYLMVVILGTYLAPVAAGYVAASQGWRWVFWYCIIFMGATFLVMLVGLEETKFESNMIFGERARTPAPEKVSNIEKDKSTELQQVPSAISSAQEPGLDHSIPKRSYMERHAFLTPTRNSATSCWKRFARQTYLPFYILALFPAVMFSALQYAWSESMLSFLAITQATLYPLPPYRFSAIGIGNMNIPPAIGAIIGSMFGGPFSDYLILAIAKRRGGIFEPEYRLWTFLIPGFAMVAGVLMYGLTISEVRPPFVPH
jgi:MFS family permease